MEAASRRIGDRERDAAVALLQQAVADGRLTVDELAGRLDTAMNARTEAELRANPIPASRWC